MSNAILPALPGRDWPYVKTFAYNTKVQRAVSGKEYRAAFQQYPLYNFSLPYSLLRDALAFQELQKLVGFFMARQGAYDSFLYDDPTDDAVTAQNFGTGDGNTANYQLVRTYGAGGFTANDLVQNVNVITGVYDNGVAVPAGAGAGKYTINSTGLITFGTVPVAGHALTWTGTYYYRCRFLKDDYEFANFMMDTNGTDRLWDLKALDFVGSPQNKV